MEKSRNQPLRSERLPSVKELIDDVRFRDGISDARPTTAIQSSRIIFPEYKLGDTPRTFTTLPPSQFVPPNIPNEFADYFYTRRLSAGEAYPSQYPPPKYIKNSSSELSLASSPLNTGDQNINSGISLDIGTLVYSIQNARSIEDKISNKYRNLLQASSGSISNTDSGILMNLKDKNYIGKKTIYDLLESIKEEEFDFLVDLYNKNIVTINKMKSLKMSRNSFEDLNFGSSGNEKKPKPPFRRSFHHITTEGLAEKQRVHDIKVLKKPRSKSISGHRRTNSTGDIPITPNIFQGGLNTELSVKSNTSCEQCNSKNTPEWRRGPNGSRTLCNACGLYYSKLIKKCSLVQANRIMKNKREKGQAIDRRIL